MVASLAADEVEEFVMVFASATCVPLPVRWYRCSNVAVLVNADDRVIDNRMAISFIHSMVPYLWAVQDLEREILAGNNDGRTGANRAGLRKRQAKPQS